MERKGGGGGIKWKLRRGLVGGVRVNSVECMGERCFGRCLCALPHCTEGETRWQWLTEGVMGRFNWTWPLDFPLKFSFSVDS